ncbi:MAG: hypothetical protein OXU73_00060 [Candidatus Campbellbacteria bacterium]|nr:hypothetical protein [Candidatus Campbellbacteria bacterium]
MKKDVVAAIEIGSSKIKVLIARENENVEQEVPEIIGRGIADANGVHNNNITNAREVAKALRRAIKQAERESNEEIDGAFVSVGGVHTEGRILCSKISISHNDPINEEDIMIAEKELIKRIESQFKNDTVIFKAPVYYELDDKKTYNMPIGLVGKTLQVFYFIVTCFDQHIETLEEVCDLADIEVEHYFPTTVASSFVALNPKQKQAGCMIINMGWSSTSTIIYENDVPISLKAFPFGCDKIVADLAVGFRIPIEEAEEIMRKGAVTRDIPRQKTEKIIEKRLKLYFADINKHLKEMGKEKLLPGGVVISGSCISIVEFDSVARSSLGLPAQRMIIGPKQQIPNTSWIGIYGLARWGLEERGIGSSFSIKDFFSGIARWFKNLFPVP